MGYHTRSTVSAAGVLDKRQNRVLHPVLEAELRPTHEGTNWTPDMQPQRSSQDDGRGRVTTVASGRTRDVSLQLLAGGFLSASL